MERSEFKTQLPLILASSSKGPGARALLESLSFEVPKTISLILTWLRCPLCCRIALFTDYTSPRPLVLQLSHKRLHYNCARESASYG